MPHPQTRTTAIILISVFIHGVAFFAGITSVRRRDYQSLTSRAPTRRSVLSPPVLPSPRLISHRRRSQVHTPKVSPHEHRSQITLQDAAVLARQLAHVRGVRHPRVAHPQVPPDHVGRVGRHGARVRAHDADGRRVERVRRGVFLRGIRMSNVRADAGCPAGRRGCCSRWWLRLALAVCSR